MPSAFAVVQPSRRQPRAVAAGAQRAQRRPTLYSAGWLSLLACAISPPPLLLPMAASAASELVTQKSGRCNRASAAGARSGRRGAGFGGARWRLVEAFVVAVEVHVHHEEQQREDGLGKEIQDRIPAERVLHWRISQAHIASMDLVCVTTEGATSEV